MSELREPVRERLAARPKRGLGCAQELAAEARRDLGMRREVVLALGDKRPVVVARAANALKKVVQSDAKLLDAFAPELLEVAAVCEVVEARWNLWVLLGRVHLTAKQRALAVDMLFGAMGSASALERVHAMQALADLSIAKADLRGRVRGLLERALEDGSAAVRARARKLLRMAGS